MEYFWLRLLMVSEVMSGEIAELLTRFWKGALLMLYTRLTQVLLRKPKRGHTFFAIVAYSSVLLPLATLAIAGMFKFDELLYVDNRNYPGGPSAFRLEYMSDVFNIMCQFWSVIIASGRAELC